MLIKFLVVYSNNKCHNHRSYFQPNRKRGLTETTTNHISCPSEVITLQDMCNHGGNTKFPYCIVDGAVQCKNSYQPNLSRAVSVWSTGNNSSTIYRYSSVESCNPRSTGTFRSAESTAQVLPPCLPTFITTRRNVKGPVTSGRKDV